MLSVLVLVMVFMSTGCKTLEKSNTKSSNNYTILQPVIGKCQAPQYFPAWRIEKKGKESVLVGDPETPLSFLWGRR